MYSRRLDEKLDSEEENMEWQAMNVDIFKNARLAEATAKAEKCRTNHLVKESVLDVVKEIEARAGSECIINIVKEEAHKKGLLNTILNELEKDPDIKRAIQDKLESETMAEQAMLDKLEAVDKRCIILCYR